MLLRASVIFLSLMLLTSNVTQGHQGLTNATNEYRTSNGLAVLTSDSVLDGFAEQRVREIVNDFSHRFWWANLTCWRASGENLAWANNSVIQASGQSVEQYFITQWRNSPVHNSNMLGNYTNIGTAILAPGNGSYYAVQIFTLPCSQTVTPAPVAPPPPQIIVPPVTTLPNTSTSP